MRVGPSRYKEYDALHEQVDLLLGNESYSIFAETFNRRLSTSIADGETIGGVMQEVL